MDSLRVYYQCPSEHFKTKFFEAFLMFGLYSGAFLENVIRETSENIGNYVEDFLDQSQSLLKLYFASTWSLTFGDLRVEFFISSFL